MIAKQHDKCSLPLELDYALLIKKVVQNSAEVKKRLLSRHKLVSGVFRVCGRQNNQRSKSTSRPTPNSSGSGNSNPDPDPDGPGNTLAFANLTVPGGEVC